METKSALELVENLNEWLETIAIPSEYIGRSFSYFDFFTSGQKAAFTRKINQIKDACKRENHDYQDFMEWCSKNP